MTEHESTHMDTLPLDNLTDEQIERIQYLVSLLVLSNLNERGLMSSITSQVRELN